MANLTPAAGRKTVPVLEVTTPALGGVGGPMNSQAQALLDRTEDLYAQITVVQSVVDGIASLIEAMPIADDPILFDGESNHDGSQTYSEPSIKSLFDDLQAQISAVVVTLDGLDTGDSDSGHIIDATDAHAASAISFIPTSPLTSVNVQAAVTEIAGMIGDYTPAPLRWNSKFI
jgi:hypothetical protein